MRKTPLLVALTAVVAAVLLASLNAARAADWPFVTNPDGGTNAIPMVVSPTNGTSAVSSALTFNRQYSIQCKSAARYRPCTVSNCVAGANDYLVPTNGMDVPLTVATDGNTKALYLAFYADGADTTCSIFMVVPGTLPGFTQGF